jgi:hypothetical protein
VDKNDVEVHFTFTTKSGEEIVRKAEFAAADVHKQGPILQSSVSAVNFMDIFYFHVLDKYSPKNPHIY